MHAPSVFQLKQRAGALRQQHSVHSEKQTPIRLQESKSTTANKRQRMKVQSTQLAGAVYWLEKSVAVTGLPNEFTFAVIRIKLQ